MIGNHQNRVTTVTPSFNCSILIAIVLCTTAARAAPIEPHVYNDDPDILSITYKGSTVFADEPAFERLPVVGLMEWFNAGDVTEEQKANGHDRLEIRVEVQHLIPPHAEGAGISSDFKFMIDAENYSPATHPKGATIYMDRVVPHGGHQDSYDLSLKFETVERGGKFDIINYELSIAALHPTGQKVGFRPGSGRAEPTALAAASFPDATGTLSLFLDADDKRFYATIVAEGLGAEDLTGARIRADTGADADPTLFALSREMFALGPADSLVATLKAVELTADATAALLAGEAYIEFLTTDFPTGALRGSIEVRAIPPLVGDLNGDRAFDNFDIAPFELALTNKAAFAAQYPGVNPLIVGDANQDGAFDNFDIAAFEHMLTQASAPGGAEVPEPSALAALSIFAASLWTRRRIPSLRR